MKEAASDVLWRQAHVYRGEGKGTLTSETKPQAAGNRCLGADLREALRSSKASINYLLSIHQAQL